VFVDSGAWFAAAVPWDANHAAAAAWLAGNTAPLLTTDYVVDEAVTLLKSRREPGRALVLGDQFFNGTLATLYFLTESDLHSAWQVFRKFKDKDWSYTDCTSKVVIEKLGLTTAFTFDHHFRQFGTLTVVP
jgi:predicted nucleic acid-binding protein